MFDRPRRSHRSKSQSHSSSSARSAENGPSAEPWVALAIEGLIEDAKKPQDAVAPHRPKPEPPQPVHYSTAAVLPAVGVAVVAAVLVFQGAIRGAVSESWIGDGSRTSLERATAVASRNPLAWLSLGLRQSGDGDAAAATASLTKAAELAPSNAAARVALGLELERAGRFDEAERTLLDAAAVHGGFAPRWSLTNYYQRRGNWDEVWRWSNEAIRADPSQLPVVASLCWRANADPRIILDRAVPDLPETNRAYFGYLYDLGRLEAMQQGWERFAAAATTADAGLAVGYVDRLIEAGLVTDAVAAWNLLCDRVLLPHAPLGADEGRFLTNPYFLTEPTGVGFDWAARSNRGVTWIVQEDTRGRGALEFRLSGAQDNEIVLLSQTLPVGMGAYELGFEFSTQGMSTHTGVGWEVRSLGTGEVLRAFESLNNAEGFWNSAQVVFSAPEGTEAVALELYYQDVELGVRRLGAARLRNVSLEKIGDEGLPTP